MKHTTVPPEVVEIKRELYSRLDALENKLHDALDEKDWEAVTHIHRFRQGMEVALAIILRTYRTGAYSRDNSAEESE
jgi:hypothetical protein